MRQGKLAEIDMSLIRTNPYQPRKNFDEDDIRSLADSIAQVGLIQPILVRQIGDYYEIIAGERRLRACQELGKETITAVVSDVDPGEQQVMAMVENIHRKDLSPVEEAWGMRDILDRTGWGQSELARRLGRSQASVANKLRLLKLEEPIQKMIMEGFLTERAARSLVGLSPNLQVEAANAIIDQELTAKEAEVLAASMKDGLGQSDGIPVQPDAESLQDGGPEERPDTQEASSSEPSEESKKPGAKGLPFNGPEGPTGDLLHQLASLVESHRKKGVPVMWKVKELAQTELVVEIVVDLKGPMMEEMEEPEE